MAQYPTTGFGVSGGCREAFVPKEEEEEEREETEEGDMEKRMRGRRRRGGGSRQGPREFVGGREECFVLPRFVHGHWRPGTGLENHNSPAANAKASRKACHLGAALSGQPRPR